MSPLNRPNFGRTELHVPRIFFGTSAFGNLYQALSYEEKLEIAEEWFTHVDAPVALDSAGKYGAGLALETLGKVLRELNRNQGDLVLSNKLGWLWVPLEGVEPSFEPGVWKDLEHDAVQDISYDGIRRCWEQGCELLGEEYKPQLASVHDPDEYLGAAENENERARRLEDIVDAYRALEELKSSGSVRAIGVGAKDWRIIEELTTHIDFDWVMFACSLTVFIHPGRLLELVQGLVEKNIAIVNSAIFNAGFLVGGDFFDYRKPDPVGDASLFSWREGFFDTCREYEVNPSEACVEFSLSIPGVVSIAMNTSNPKRIKQNVESLECKAPPEFWVTMKKRKLIDPDFPYLG